jgi:hypothetical protein
MDSPLARMSTRGTPADTDATLLCTFDAPYTQQQHGSHPGEVLLGSSSSPHCGNGTAAAAAAGVSGVVVAIDAQLAAALVPTHSRGYAAAAVAVAGEGGGYNSGGYDSGQVPAAAGGAGVGVVAFSESSPAGSSSPPAADPVLCLGEVQRQPQQQQQISRLGGLSGAGGSSSTGSLSNRGRGSSSGGGAWSSSRAAGPYSEALLSSVTQTPMAADAAAAAGAVEEMPSSQGAAEWTLPR